MSASVLWNLLNELRKKLRFYRFSLTNSHKFNITGARMQYSAYLLTQKPYLFYSPF